MSFEFRNVSVKDVADAFLLEHKKDLAKVQLFCGTVGLPIPSIVQVDKINSICKTHLSKNPISFQLSGKTVIFEINDVEPFIEYFKTHKECKVLDIQHFSKVNNLIKLLDFVPNSQIEKIVISSELKDTLKEEEQKALIKAKTLKPSLQLSFVDHAQPETKPVPVKSPASNTNSAPSSPPHASVKPAAGSGNTTPNHSPNSSKESSPTSSPLSTSPEKAGNKPPIPPKRTSPNPSKETSEITSAAKPPVPPIKVSNSATGESSTITTSTKVATHRQPPSSSASTPQPTAQPRDPVKLKEWEEKLQDKTALGRPAYTVLLEYLVLNSDKTLEEGVVYVDDIRFKELKIQFKNKKIHGLPIPVLMEYYIFLHPSALLHEISDFLRDLIRKEKLSDEFVKEFKEFEKKYQY